MSAQQYAEQGAQEEWESEKAKEAEYLKRLTDKFPGIPTSWPMPQPKDQNENK